MITYEGVQYVKMFSSFEYHITDILNVTLYNSLCLSSQKPNYTENTN